MNRLLACFTTGAFAAVATPALAQPVVVADSGDSAWVLAASLIALIATPTGLMLLRARPAQRPVILIAMAVAALVFATIGYSLAFGEGSSLLGGVGNAMLGNLADLRVGATIPESAYALYETMVVIIALAVLASAVADRIRLVWFVPFSVLWLLIVYVPVARWMWGGGWLAELGALDFAGGIVVHVVAGVAALVVGLLLRGKLRDDDAISDKTTGAAVLTLGWLAVVGGAALGGGDDAAIAILDAALAAAAALLTGFALGSLRKRTDAYDSSANATIAALAAVGTGAGFIGPFGAIMLGIVAAMAVGAVIGAIAKLQTGNAGDAFVAHGIGGMVGAILFPLFVLPVLGGPGLAEGASLITQLAAQAVATLAVALWTAVATVIAALAVSIIAPIRAD